ncbi:MAG: MlaD family protein [Sulfurovum sp.]|nr:MlaD family protein [Sulfurovum sp.]
MPTYTEENSVKEAVWQKKKKGISTVWIVPIVALVIGAWLFLQETNEKGPEIKIMFKSAAGIQANKTVIKYKDIEVGKVTEVTFGPALKNVIVKAELKKNMKSFLSENTRFWVVQAKVGMGEIQGLDTLLSGVYIVMDPKKGEKSVRSFKGLDEIPVVTSGEEGKTFMLKADNIGSLDVGSPIYYKKLKAGSVASYDLDKDGKKVNIEVFIKKPFSDLVNSETRFFNASGISAEIGTDGVEVRMESLVSLIMGGLAFENFPAHGRGEPVASGHTFWLYDSYKEAKKLEYKRVLYFWVYFQDSIRGLSIGAPVEFHGVKIGEVVSYSLVGNSETAEFKIPILIKIEPERFILLNSKSPQQEDQVDIEIFTKLLKKGFRAQLKSGNLLTGELYIDFDFYKDLPYQEPQKEYGYYVIPTVPTELASLKNNAQELLNRISKIPFEEIGHQTEGLIKDLRKETIPQVNRSVASLDRLIQDTSRMMNAARKNYMDSTAEINKKLLKLLDEMTRTTRSIKHLTDYLERHPESLIKGK